MQMFMKLKNILKQKNKTKKIEVEKTFFLTCAIKYSLYFYVFSYFYLRYIFFFSKEKQ